MVKLFKIFFITVFIMLLNTQCGLEKDAVLPNSMPYVGNQLRMDGYYYQIASNNVIYNSLIMYANGVLINFGGAENTMEEMDEYIKENYIRSLRHKKQKYSWGVFFIDDNNAIRINRLSADYPHRMIAQEGVILNDTTFKTTKYFCNGRVTERDEIYHFRPFSPKPDSTNVYIK